MAFSMMSTRMACSQSIALAQRQAPANTNFGLGGKQAITWRPVQPSSLRHVSNRSTRAMRPVQANTIGKGEFPVADPEKQKRMHEVAKSMDTFFGQKDYSSFDAVVDPNVTLHKDLLILDQDVHGAEEVKKTLRMYIDNYDYHHETIAKGDDVTGSSMFHCWLHQDLKPKSGEAAESNESKASIWRYVINPEGKISDIHFLTQLTPEEKQVMLKDPGMGTGISYDVMDLAKQEKIEEDDNRAANLLESAQQFSEIWETGNPAAADEIMSKDVREISPIVGQELKGRDSFKQMIEGLYSKYERTGGSSAFAVDRHANKAFVYWESKGKMEGSGPDGVSLYGLNLLVFDDFQQIKTVLGFRQLLPSERVKYLKRVPEKAGVAA